MGSADGARHARRPAFCPYARHAASAPARRMLAEHDDAVLAAYVETTPVAFRSDIYATRSPSQTRRGPVHPVFFGSAITGAGVDALIGAHRRPAAHRRGRRRRPRSGRVFKIDAGRRARRSPTSACSPARYASGPAAAGGREQRSRAISVFDAAPAVPQLGRAGRSRSCGGSATCASATRSAPAVRWRYATSRRRRWRRSSRRAAATSGALRVALAQLAEQDPLINLRQDDVAASCTSRSTARCRRKSSRRRWPPTSASRSTFRETTTICIERPHRFWRRARASCGKYRIPFPAAIGLRVDPAPVGSGVAFRVDVDPRTLPIHIYKTADNFFQHMRE